MGCSLHGIHADISAYLNLPLPVNSNVADHIVSFEVLEHLAEPCTMQSEAFRILKPGGSLTLSVQFQWWVHEAPLDYYRYTRYGLEHLLIKSGFVDVSNKPTTGFWTMWILKLNYQTTRLIRGNYPARILIRALLIPFWWVTQTIAPRLDHFWFDDRETTGYLVTARKP